MILTFIGHGYVGLVTATVFAELGNTVYVIGHTKKKIDDLKKGILPIYEPGLEEMVKRNIAAKRLLFTLDYSPAIAKSDVVFIAVGTPPKPTGDADLSVVYEVAKQIGTHLDGYTVVITKSTVPVGTNYKVKKILEDVKPPQVTFDVASVPEFLREGQAIGDTLYPDRVIIGTESEKAAQVLSDLHKPLIKTEGEKETKLVLTSIPTAEMIKYASNAFLATKISFANAIAQLSEASGANGPDVLKAVGFDKRIGTAFLNAGAGYGGSCFPKDVKALIAIAKDYGYDFTLLTAVEEINKQAIESITVKAEKLLNGTIEGKTIGVLGLSFKPDTDDMRDASSVVVISSLLKKGATIQVYDPIAMENAKKIFVPQKNLIYKEDAYKTAEGADLLILMTEWNEFIELDLARIKQGMKTPILLDGRNIYDPQKVRELGFTYQGVGQ